MAKARMLARSIAIDKALNELSIKFQLIYTWCIPFLDDYGLLTNDADKIKYMIFPRNKNITEEDIKFFFDQAGELIVRLSDCIFFKGFDKHNTITDYKRAKSEFKQNRYNKPKKELSPESPREPHAAPSEDKISKDKLIEDNNIYNAFAFFSDSEFKTLYDDYRVMRKKIRAPMTKRGEELILKKLHTESVEIAKAMLRASIENSWRGVFKPNVQVNSEDLQAEKQKRRKQYEEDFEKEHGYLPPA